MVEVEEVRAFVALMSVSLEFDGLKDFTFYEFMKIWGMGYALVTA